MLNQQTFHAGLFERAHNHEVELANNMIADAEWISLTVTT
jgi:hypothetical protein